MTIVNFRLGKSGKMLRNASKRALNTWKAKLECEWIIEMSVLVFLIASFVPFLIPQFLSRFPPSYHSIVNTHIRSRSWKFSHYCLLPRCWQSIQMFTWHKKLSFLFFLLRLFAFATKTFDIVFLRRLHHFILVWLLLFLLGASSVYQT